VVLVEEEVVILVLVSVSIATGGACIEFCSEVLVELKLLVASLDLSIKSSSEWIAEELTFCTDLLLLLREICAA